LRYGICQTMSWSEGSSVGGVEKLLDGRPYE